MNFSQNTDVFIFFLQNSTKIVTYHAVTIKSSEKNKFLDSLFPCNQNSFQPFKIVYKKQVPMKKKIEIIKK